MYEWGFFVKPGQMEEVKRWLAENEAAFDEATPPGLSYLGTYLPIWAEDPRCDLYQLWSWRRRGPDFDLRSAASADRGKFAELAAEFLAFVDEGRSREETFRLHRRVVDDVTSSSKGDSGPTG
jgi:hypothetical protein